VKAESPPGDATKAQLTPYLELLPVALQLSRGSLPNAQNSPTLLLNKQRRSGERQMFVHRIALLSATMAALVATPALAQKQYGPGVSDTEIKIGQTIAYRGPASAYCTLGRAQVHYPMLKNSKIAGLRNLANAVHRRFHQLQGPVESIRGPAIVLR
jgi:hypothetical protein